MVYAEGKQTKELDLAALGFWHFIAQKKHEAFLWCFHTHKPQLQRD